MSQYEKEGKRPNVSGETSKMSTLGVMNDELKTLIIETAVSSSVCRNKILFTRKE